MSHIIQGQRNIIFYDGNTNFIEINVSSPAVINFLHNDLGVSFTNLNYISSGISDPTLTVMNDLNLDTGELKINLNNGLRVFKMLFWNMPYYLIHLLLLYSCFSSSVSDYSYIWL